MKHKPIVSAEEKHLLASGHYRVMQGDYELVGYPENTSVSVRYVGKPDAFDVHFHSAVEIHLPLRGGLITLAGETEYHLQAREILIIPAGCRHGLRMGADSERELILYEPNSVFSLKEFAALRQMMAQPIYITIDHPHHEAVWNLLMRFIRVHRESGELRNMHCYAILLEVYALLGETYLQTQATVAEKNALRRQFSGEDAFNRAVEYIRGHYMDSISLDSLAVEVGFSRYTLSRMFRQRTGMTFIQFLSRERVEQAMALLLETDLPMTQIAVRCGFSAIATFNRVFREVKGCTPTQYREIYRAKE